MGKKNIKWTYELVKEYVESLEYILISKEYTNNREKLTLKDIEGYYYQISLGDLKSGYNPNKFDKSNSYTIQNIELWCKLNNKNFEIISDIYVDSKSVLKWKCLKKDCGEIFDSTWSDISNNRGCAYCRGFKVSIVNCLATTHPHLISEWHKTLNGKLTPYDITHGSSKEIWWQCNKNINHIWRLKLNSRTSMNTNCPYCSLSKGEIKIGNFLILNNINYIPQKEFEGLVGLRNGNLSYDFYLPDYNLLIEYQGEFHDGNTRNQTKFDLKRQQEHDKRKKEYAHNMNITFLEIWYWDFDNIEEILSKELNLNKNKLAI